MEKYDKALEYEIFVKKEYSFADEVIEKAKCIFDIGGHIGYFTKYCLMINPGCTIHYFEPVPELYQQAKELIQNQNCYLNNFGIAAVTGTQKFYVNTQKTMQSSAYNETFLNPKGESIQVKMKNLQEYCDENQIQKIDLLKIDVEGMEYEIFESLSDEFLKKIQAITLEFHCFSTEMERKIELLKERLSTFGLVKQFAQAYSHHLGYLFVVAQNAQ